ncbi:hypothetical protein EV363DRAFT_1312786 [Boletus edulis]|uniref:PEHE domain-containing protein n=1 Tax=Boletus edulis BED1 TaxID=1328754 RepID=A0AAD4C0V4_BOLED|nr:hypothetical protein EV363DRAFT_1312786 [Boletus edulis]KAF8445637.1 hypothetical protein L210DRAFT_936359 [Boletus edulis BED1]
MADASHLTTPHPRQKRVLPTRSRRGGPGIGSCDVDLMILDAQKRRLDNEPLIPTDTPFLLTTDSGLLQPSSMAASFGLNTFANQRYFDRADVIKAYREQLNIQTPEFSLLSEEATVGGRFRPRSSGEQDNADTSDAAYEKRHRKYEFCEKRQRLREKEKLKHEQYKLKERVEQLRLMDDSAFLGLPAASFSQPPAANEDKSGVSLSDTQTNVNPIYDEGERRRQEMLEVASILEERYRTLLPSEKKLADLKDANRLSSMIPQAPDICSLESNSIAREASSQVSPKPTAPSIILKIKVPQTRHKGVSSPGANSNSVHTPSSPTKPFSKVSSDTLSVTSDRPYKRYRTSRVDDAESPSRPTSEYATTKSSHSTTLKSEPCVLMQWALRNQAAPNARKTQRHVTAFGTKVPQSLEEVRDFELPEWIRPRSPTIISDRAKDSSVPSIPLPEHPSAPTLQLADISSHS